MVTFTRNQVKVSFQDHPPNVPKPDPNLVQSKAIEPQNLHNKGSFKTIEDGSKKGTPFKTIGENGPKIDSFQDHYK